MFTFWWKNIVEKNWAPNFVCGQKGTNMRHVDAPHILTIFTSTLSTRWCWYPCFLLKHREAGGAGGRGIGAWGGAEGKLWRRNWRRTNGRAEKKRSREEEMRNEEWGEAEWKRSRWGMRKRRGDKNWGMRNEEKQRGRGVEEQRGGNEKWGMRNEEKKRSREEEMRNEEWGEAESNNFHFFTRLWPCLTAQLATVTVSFSSLSPLSWPWLATHSPSFPNQLAFEVGLGFPAWEMRHFKTPKGALETLIRDSICD